MPESTPENVGGFGNPPTKGRRRRGVNAAIHLARLIPEFANRR